MARGKEPAQPSERRTAMRRTALALVALLVSACSDAPASGDGGSDGGASEDARIAARYAADPIAYWADDGLPSVIRGAGALEELGDPTPFSELEDLFSAFQEDAFLTAVEEGSMPPFLRERYELVRAGAPELPAVEALQRALAITVQRVDDQRRWDPADPVLAEERAELATLLGLAFGAGRRGELTPTREKPVEREAAPGDRVECQEPEPAPRPQDPPPARWTQVATSATWPGIPNGKCATLAAGMCLGRLGEDDGTVSCEKWETISRGLQALPTGGATRGDQETFFEEKGYCYKRAGDCPRALRALGCDSACEEARAAIRRGCDVFLHYWDGERGHVEYVHRVRVDPAPGSPYACTVQTQDFAGIEDVRVEDGGYSAKSNADHHAELGATGEAEFSIVCRCD